MSGPGRHREQHHGVGQRRQVVPVRRDHDVIAGGALPGVLTGGEADPADHHLQGRLAGCLVLAEGAAVRQGDQGLPQVVLVATVNGDGGAAAGGGPGLVELLLAEAGE